MPPTLPHPDTRKAGLPPAGMPRRRAALRPLGLATLALACSALMPAVQAATTIEFGSGTRVAGSGRVTEQSRSLPHFTRLRVDGSMTVNASPGSSTQAVVKADDNIAPLILTEVEGDTLVVKTRPGASFSTRSPMVVNLTFTQLTQADLRGSGDLNLSAITGAGFELSLAGSGDARIQGAQLERFTGRLAGSGDIWAQGRADAASFSIAGSGDVRADELAARAVTVSIAGSGDARVHATESLSAQVAGSGDVTYSGNPPKVSRSVVGSGEVRAR